MARHVKRATSQVAAVDVGDDTKDVHEPLPSHAGARLAARSALAVALVAGSLWVAAEFLPALLWAGIFAITTWPLYERFSSKFSNKTASPLAALVFTLAVGLTIFLPLALATYQIAQQSGFLLGWIASAREQGIPVPEWAIQLPIAASAITEWWRENLSDPKMAATWLETFNAENSAGWVRTIGGQLVQRSFMFFVSLMALFVMLRTGPGLPDVCWTRQIVYLAIPASGSQARWSPRPGER